ncbi:hypothetical protein Bca4012_049661 [Brassica carinata]
MKTSPSNIINKEVEKTLIVDFLTTLSQVSGFKNLSRFTVLDDEDQATNEPINLLGLTRSEKETKSHIKYQDLKGKTMQKNVSMIGAVVVLLASCSFSFYFGSSLLCFRSFKV